MTNENIEFGPFDAPPVETAPKGKKRKGRPRKSGLKQALTTPVKTDLPVGHQAFPPNVVLDAVIKIIDVLKPQSEAVRKQILVTVERLL
jgi:hypothetical protein